MSLGEPAAEQVRAWHAVVVASMAHDLPGLAPPDLERFRMRLATGPTAAWAATVDGEVVGLAMLCLSTPVATAKAQVHVHPAYRCRGIGSGLLAALAAEARARGRNGVILAAPADGPGDGLCLRRGLTRVRTLHHLLLSMDDVHPAWLDELVAVEHPGYRLAGTADVTRPGRRGRVPGDVLLTVAAEHARQVVGCTEVVIPGGIGTRVTQHDHPLVAGHRGLGLDLWIKAAMLRTLHDEYPQVDQVATDNAEHDADLLAVNRHLGFRLHHRTNEYRLDLPRP
ncbi:GNAT family N-acetyltransferase [Actinoallomurus vinaceus]|uniref:GNAT family N-acetyltransferase n=1 Tax=Actinoallomurus vinaceus TaxID=1080074 RepID=A0ABP8UMB6_9ACTN